MKHKRIGIGGSKVKGKRAAGIFFTDGKSVLVLKRSEDSVYGGTWSLPGGKTKQGETQIGAAIRETKEETGLENIPGYRFESFDSRDGHQTFTCFMYRVSETFDVDISDEHTEWKWMFLEDLTGEELHPKFRDDVPRYIKSIRRKIQNFSEWTEVTSLIESSISQRLDN